MTQHIWKHYLDNKVWCNKIVEYDSLYEAASWAIRTSTCLDCWENVVLTIGIEDEGVVDGYVFDPRPTHDE